MMARPRFSLLLLSALLFGFGVSSSSAFATTSSQPSLRPSSGGITTTAITRGVLQAKPLDIDNSPSPAGGHQHQQPRRQFLRSIRRAIVGAATFSAFRQAPKVAVADVSVPTSGKIVTMEVTNLDGIPSKTGIVKIQIRPEWAPTGARRFETLIKEKFYDNCRIFRVLPGMVAQLGIHGKPEIQSQWRSMSIPDDNVKVSNTRGTVVFANAGPNTRTTQIFFNTREEGNDFLDNQGFAPFGHVIEGMDIVDQFYAGYGEGEPDGLGPNQALLQARGDSYLSSFPKLSFIKKATIV